MIFPVRAIRDQVLVDIFDQGEQTTKAGLIIPDDDFTERGVRPRQATVLALGPNAIDQGIELGDTVLIDHGDWSRKVEFDDPDNCGKKVRYWMTEITRVLAVVEQ